MRVPIRSGNVRSLHVLPGEGGKGMAVFVVCQDGRDIELKITDKRMAFRYRDRATYWNTLRWLAFVESCLRPGQLRLLRAQLRKEVA